MNNVRRSFIKTVGIVAFGSLSSYSLLGAKGHKSYVKDLAAFNYALFPHKGLNMKFYEKSAKDMLANKKNKNMIIGGLVRINKVFSKPFSKLRVNDKKNAVKYISNIDADFFSHVRGFLVTGLYNNKGTWSYFGYEGASFEKGGYIGRGFDDISWIKG